MTTRTASRFLDAKALTALAHLRFSTGQRLEGAYSGRHRSRRQGGAGQFADFREYAEGEDLRRLDWKVLARTGRAYTRLYQDETNLIATLVLDASASMRFGSGGTKLEYAQYLTTALSEVIGRQQDQVGLAVVDREIRAFMTPGSTPSHVGHLQDAIEKVDARQATDLGKCLGDLFQRLSRRGVLLLFSDFLVDRLEDVFASLRLFRHRRWEVILLHLVHPDEERLPEGAAFRFEGLEGEGIANCSPAEIRLAYEQRFENHAAAVRTLALAAGCDYRRISTTTPYLRTLGTFLVERQG